MATWLDKAERYLASAQLLLDARHYESAVSRAYYAARYGAIHLFLARRVGWTPHWQHDSIARQLHEQARRLLWLRPVVMGSQSKFAASWTELLKHRNEADYELSKINQRIAERSVAFARLFVQTVKENLP